MDGTLPQPPLTEGDPRLQAFLRVNFDVFYDWNIQTGAVYFAEQLDELLGLPPGGFPRSLEGWLEYVHPHDHDAVCADLWESRHHRAVVPRRVPPPPLRTAPTSPSATRAWC